MAKDKAPTPEQEEADQVKAIRDDFEHDWRQWEPVYKQADLDRKFIAGDPFEDNDKRARADAGRAALLSFDELGQYINEAVNDVRANPVAGKFDPTGDGANDETAQFYEGLAREIDYQSNAKMADTSAFENCLQSSMGFVRIYSEYEHPLSFAQQLRIGAVPNTNCIVPDADAIRPDGSDWKRLSFIEKYSREEFKREFPKAQFKDYSREQVNIGPAWGSENHVQVIEFWRLEMKETTIQQWEMRPTLKNPQPQIKVIRVGIDRAPRSDMGRMIQERVTEIPEVTSRYTNGLEILEKVGRKVHPWAGDAIPFASCYGKILWLNKAEMGSERTILSMTRLARAPYQAYCFAVSCLVEAVGMITKNPYVAYEGQLTADHMNLIAKSLHEPVAVLLSKPFIDSMPGVLLPMLQRNPLTMDLSSYLQMAELCRQAIRAAMGMGYLPTPAQRNNEKSGVALDKIADSGKRGTYHFKDAYYMMLRRRLEIEENLIDRLYDTPRDVNIRTNDDQSERWRINDPQAQAGKDENVLPSIKGRHSVTISIGPQEGSQREAADTFVDTFVTSPLMQALEPGKRDKILALAVKARNIGPMGDKIADTISPPESDEGQPDPQQLMAALKQGQGLIQQLTEHVKELESGQAAKQMELQAKATIAQRQDETKREITGTQEAGDMARAELKAKTDIELETMRHASAAADREMAAEQEARKLAHDATKTIHQQVAASESQTQAEEAAETAAENAAAREPEPSKE